MASKKIDRRTKEGKALLARAAEQESKQDKKKQGTGALLKRKRASLAKARKAVKTKASPRTKVVVVRRGAGKVRVKAVTKKRVKTDPAKEAKKFLKSAERLEKFAVRFTKNAAKLREKAAVLAVKSLNKADAKRSPKAQADLEEIARIGLASTADQAMSVVESPEGTAEALAVVAEVLKGSAR
jgi:hypothetical protein